MNETTRWDPRRPLAAGKVAAAFIGLLLLATSAQAQVATGTILGTSRTRPGRPSPPRS